MHEATFSLAILHSVQPFLKSRSYHASTVSQALCEESQAPSFQNEPLLSPYSRRGSQGEEWLGNYSGSPNREGKEFLLDTKLSLHSISTCSQVKALNPSYLKKSWITDRFEGRQFQLILGNSNTKSKMLSSSKIHYLSMNPSVPAEFCRNDCPLETGGAIWWGEATKVRPSLITSHVRLITLHDWQRVLRKLMPEGNKIYIKNSFVGDHTGLWPWGTQLGACQRAQQGTKHRLQAE